MVNPLVSGKSGLDHLIAEVLERFPNEPAITPNWIISPYAPTPTIIEAAKILYVREDEKQKILVVCSFGEKNVTFTAPKDFDLGAAELILTNYETNEGMILKPYETRVYLLNK